MNSKKITLIRHAPTRLSDECVFMGDMNPPVSEVGIIKTIELGRKLSNVDFDVCYSSPKLRAYSTAEVLFRKELIVVDIRLTERSLGDWVGKYHEDIKSEFPGSFQESGSLNPYYEPPNGEPLSSLIERVYLLLKDILILDNVSNVAIISHNGPISTAKFLLGDCTLEEAFSRWIPYCETIPYIVDKSIFKHMESKFENFISK